MFVRSKWKRRVASLALAATVIPPPAALFAAEQRKSKVDLEDRVRVLEQKLEQYEKQEKARLKAIGTPAPVSQPVDQQAVAQIVDDKLKQQKVLAGWQDGFFLQSPGGDFKLKIRGYAQADARVFPREDGDTGTDQFYLRRLRPIFEGTVYKYFDFKTMLDFGDGKTVLQDGYLDVTYFPYAKLRAGKTKSPLSLERLQSGSDLLFVERSIANNIPTNREVGLALWGDIVPSTPGLLTYMAGVFNGSFDGGSNDNDTTSDKDYETRIFAQPFIGTGPEPLQNLGFGFGTTWGQSKGEDLSGMAYKTAGRSTFFKLDLPKNTTETSAGQRFRYSPQAYYYYGPFGFMGEYDYSKQELRKTLTPTSGTPTSTDGKLNNDGFFIQASYLLTGEKATYKTVVPINAFDPRNGRWGAFELAARYSAVDIDKKAFEQGFAVEGKSTSGAQEYTAGVNWYFNKNFKINVNYARTEFDTPITFGAKTRDHEDLFLTRFQLSY